MRAKRVPIMIRIEPALHDGLKRAVAQYGESAGVIIRSLLRQDLTQRGILEPDVRAIAEVRPIGRADK